MSTKFFITSWLWGVLVIAVAGCGGGDPGNVTLPEPDISTDTAPDLPWSWDIAPGDLGPGADTLLDIQPVDGVGELPMDLLPGDLPPETFVPTPCSSHEDCGEGLCIEHPPGSGNSVCAPLCTEGCPPGWECRDVQIDGPDPVSVCIPPLSMLCATCSENKDCLFAGSLCIIDQGDEGVCGRTCAQGAGDCPEGFDCQIVNDAVGEPMAYQCRPVAGACCAGGDWVDCDDDNPCTLDACQSGVGCLHEAQDMPCEGPAPCTDYQCVDGECVGWPITEDMTWDGVDDDCDGQTDEDVVQGLQVPAWTYGSGLGVSMGGGLRLMGKLNTPGFHGVSAGGTLVLTPEMK